MRTEDKIRIEAELRKVIERISENEKVYETLAPELRKLLNDDKIEAILTKYASLERELAKSVFELLGIVLQKEVK